MIPLISLFPYIVSYPFGEVPDEGIKYASQFKYLTEVKRLVKLNRIALVSFVPRSSVKKL